MQVENVTMFSIFILMPIIQSEVPRKVEIDMLQLHKMVFVYNAIHDGWKVELRDGKYIFSKRHEGKKEIYLDTYLERFVESNVDIRKLIIVLRFLSKLFSLAIV